MKQAVGEVNVVDLMKTTIIGGEGNWESFTLSRIGR
jgi:hypothetical protein